ITAYQMKLFGGETFDSTWKAQRNDAIKEFTRALSQERHPVLRSWATTGSWLVVVAPLTLAAGSLIICFLTYWPFRVECAHSETVRLVLLTLNLLTIVAIVGVLLKALKRASEDMPLDEPKIVGQDLDTKLNHALVRVQGEWITRQSRP